MNHLIIYAHPSNNSFSYQLKEELHNESNRRGWKTTVRDLYDIKFDPVLWPSDLENLSKGTCDRSIQVEQEHVKNADVISLIYPLWWAGFPAILKGYIDKVLAYNFAYKTGTSGIEGLLKGKRVYLYTSMGNSVDEYEQKGLLEAFKKIQGGEIFEFCGMTLENHMFFPQIPSASTDQIQFYINEAISVFEPRVKIGV